MEQFVEIKIDVPNGYKVVGYGAPKKDQFFLDNIPSRVLVASGMFTYPRIILEKVATYRNIKWPDDHLKPVEVSVDGEHWHTDKVLLGMTLNGAWIVAGTQVVYTSYSYGRVKE